VIVAVIADALGEAALDEPAPDEPALGVAAALLPHAAASSAAATGTPSLTGTGIRARNEFMIFIVSRPRRW
jgi:hypothetical protein